MNKVVFKILFVFLTNLPQLLSAQVQGDSFLKIVNVNIRGIEILYTLKDFKSEKIFINGLEYNKPLTPGVFLPGESGKPDLGSLTSFISVPRNSNITYKLYVEEEYIINNINVPPAPVIKHIDESGKPEYNFDNNIYSKNISFPENNVSLSEKFDIRGINLISLSYTPYRYNPVRKELTVYKKVRLKITFDNPSGSFSDLRLRSKWFDPIITKYILNRNRIEQRDYTDSETGDGYEYIIITPNSPQYAAIADTIRRFRNEQGIKTGVFRLSEIGGNNFFSIKNFIKNAYLNWEIPPVAVLLMADEGNSAEDKIFTPYYNNQFVTDFRYVDMNDDNLPDLIISRIPVDNALQLYNIIRNTIGFEENPPLNPLFYSKPITALGWETASWFQICTEVVGGFFRNYLGKNPVRVNDIYSGNPLTDPWSTAQNTQTVINYFGPQGLNYIPLTPQQLGGFTGGTPEMVVNAINNGSFLLLHRDHGNYTGWGKPAFNVNYINLLTNQYPITVLSINCQNGKFNWTGGGCFSEKFIQQSNNNSGTVSIISASDLSYSYLNDVFTWGIIDNIWENFIPEYNSSFNHGFMLPAFANVSGKYFLAQSNWISDPMNKIETYYLFHHFGDCFVSMFTEVPNDINLTCQNYIYAGERNLRVTADSGTLVGISHNGNFIDSKFSSGAALNLTLSGENKEGDTLLVVGTKRNSKRKSTEIPVLVNPGVYLYASDFLIYDAPPYGNGNGKPDYSEINDLSFKLINRGLKSAFNIKAVLSSSDANIYISDSVFTLNRLKGKDSVNCLLCFRYLVNSNIPDSHIVKFKMTISTGKQIWDYNFSFMGFAPVLEIGKISISDSTANNNGVAEPGDTVYLKLPVLNTGSSQARMISGKMTLNSLQFINILTDSVVYGSINPNDTTTGKFKIFVKSNTPLGTLVIFYFKVFSPIDGKILFDSLKIIIGGVGTVYIGKGTKNVIYPYSLYWMDGKTEMLFTARELDSNGAFKAYITKIGFNAISTNYIPLNDFTIKIKYSNDTAIKNFTMQGWTLCFKDTVYISSAGWNFYNLQTPFYWNGINNIIISVCYDNYFYSKNTSVKSTVITNKTIVAYADLSTSGCDILNGSVYNDRPNIAIEFNEVIGNEITAVKIPVEYKLFANYPNPFNSSTKIKFEIPEKSFIDIKIYDILGREVATLVNEFKSPGTYTTDWQSGNLSSGVYICRMKTGKFTSSIKLLLIK